MFKFNDLKTKQKVLIGICTPLILLVILGGVSMSGINTLSHVSKWVDHTYRVMNKSADIVASAVNMETGMRGFLLAGKEGFLDPYREGETSAYEQISELKAIVSDNPVQVQRLTEASSILKDWQMNVTEPVIAMRRQVGSTQTMDDVASLVGEAKGKAYFDRFRTVMQEFYNDEAKLLSVRKAEAAASTTATDFMIGATIVIGLVIGAWLAWLIGRAIANPLMATTDAVKNLAEGQEVIIPGLERKDELGELARALQMIVEQAAVNLRTKVALDNCRTNVMVADADYNVVYANDTMIEMLKNNERDLKTDLPSFDTASLIGTNIDTFHKIPAHQRKILDALTSSTETSLEIGGLNFELIVTPITNTNGERVGTVVEWEDVTAKLAAAEEDARVASENLRIKSALDSCQTNVMVADADYNIVYSNETMLDMLRGNEASLKTDLPKFEADKVIGSNIDVFHKNPAHQRGILDTLNGTVETALLVGGINFDLVVSSIVDAAGTRIGTVVEWEDVTAKLAAAEEEARVASENLRIKSALDSCRTNVMVADADYNIVYSNETMMEMLKSNETDLKTDLPNFAADKVVGSNIDIFHKNPAHQRNVLDNQSQTIETALLVGGRNFDLVVSPILDTTGTKIGTVVEWEDVTEKLAQHKEEQRIGNENSRIKSALENCTTNIMVSDADYNIIYVNSTMRDMLQTNEPDMKKDLPSFDARTIIGTNIDTFHKNPAHQRGALDRLTGAFNTSITIGGRFYDLIASPVLNDQDERIGTVVEWADVTAERNIEEEIDTVVTAAVSGDFGTKLELEGKEGFMLKLSEAINNLSGTVSDAMEDVGASLSALSDGDLTRRITADYKGLFDALKTNANGTADQLTDIVGDISTSASEVNNAAQEINEGTMDLSQRTEQQASNLEETAAAMEEMASTVKQNAENAQQANQLSVSARDVAEKGGEVVGEVVNAMTRIEGSSQKISDIIGVIDEIAFQTNLLALNAAVEAARAGDAGKGFAVVAAEVGTLAQRSSQAAKDIKGLINDSGSQVKDGVRLVGDAGESLTEIVDSIKRLSDIVSEIAAASDEQSSSISEINRSVAQMDEMTQQNSALVEENAAASRTLQEQSEAMKERISFFSLEAETKSKSRSNGARKPKAVSSSPASNQKSSRPMAAVSGGQAAAEDWSEF